MAIAFLLSPSPWTLRSLHAACTAAWMLGLVALAGCAHPGARADDTTAPLTALAGEPGRGREVFVARDAGHCVLCHTAPGIPQAGNVGPSLQGVGGRLSPGQLRLRVMDISRLNPDAVMPSFHRVAALNAVAARYRDQPVLNAQQVEDVVAFLGTLQ